MFPALEDEVTLRRVKRARPSTKNRLEGLQTSLKRLALDFPEQRRAHPATNGFRCHIVRSHLMVLRYESADPDHSAFDLGDQAVFIVGIGQNPLDVSLGNRQRRLGFDDFHRVVLGGDFADGCLMDLKEGSRVVGAHLSDGEGSRQP
jgi:hypothetical protein